MWKQWLMVLLGLIVFGIAFIDLGAATSQWVLAIVGGAIMLLSGVFISDSVSDNSTNKMLSRK